jgi:hypothetical protein
LWEGGTSMGISDKATRPIGIGSSLSTCKHMGFQLARARRSPEYGQDVHPAGYGSMRQLDADSHCDNDKGNGRSNGGQEVKHDNQVGRDTILLFTCLCQRSQQKRLATIRCTACSMQGKSLGGYTADALFSLSHARCTAMHTQNRPSLPVYHQTHHHLPLTSDTPSSRPSSFSTPSRLNPVPCALPCGIFARSPCYRSTPDPKSPQKRRDEHATASLPRGRGAHTAAHTITAPSADSNLLWYR